MIHSGTKRARTSSMNNHALPNRRRRLSRRHYRRRRPDLCRGCCMCQGYCPPVAEPQNVTWNVNFTSPFPIQTAPPPPQPQPLFQSANNYQRVPPQYYQARPSPSMAPPPNLGRRPTMGHPHHQHGGVGRGQSNLMTALEDMATTNMGCVLMDAALRNNNNNNQQNQNHQPQQQPVQNNSNGPRRTMRPPSMDFFSFTAGTNNNNSMGPGSDDLLNHLSQSIVVNGTGDVGFFANPASLSSMFMNSNFESDAGVPETLSEEEIAALPRFQWEVSPSDDEVVCGICREGLAAGDDVCQLPCQHVFHHQCVATWFRRAANCPLCRSDPRHPPAAQQPVPVPAPIVAEPTGNHAAPQTVVEDPLVVDSPPAPQSGEVEEVKTEHVEPES